MLDKQLIDKILTEALSTGGDFAEIFVEKKSSSNLFMIDGKVESSISGRDFGIGIRIFKGLFSVYGYTNDMNEESLLKATKKIASSISGTKEDITINLIKQDIENINKIQIYPQDIKKSEKIELMKIASHSAKDYDKHISQVRVSLGDVKQNILIANSEGLFTTDERVRGRISIESVATDGNDMQTGRISPGASAGFEFFRNMDIEAEAREASSVAKENSIFAGKMGQMIASPLVSAVDDGTLPNEWGSLTIDDEGHKTQRNLLIENGILKGYLVDKLNGRRMGIKSTGSGRRESYKYAPTSRMTNTFILNGKSSFDEIIKNTEYGIYAKNMGGGSVNPATGDFNFAVMEGYIIRNGEICEPVRGATLIGNGGEVLKKIDMVGNNLGFGQGMCGSSSGSIPTNVGQSTIRVSEITVGGRK